mmetsp:Transcript_11662/g.33220  ORF Transcript_11662/g.33220 Transcript_11662/m.33220 type:complete len:303 (+) Transcript_11662:688-1596(+)
MQDGLQLRMQREPRRVEGRADDRQKCGEELQGARTPRTRLQQVLRAMHHQTRAQHASKKQLPHQPHAPESPLLSHQPRLVILSLARGAALRRKQLLEGALAPVEQEPPELVRPSDRFRNSLLRDDDALLGLEADAEVRVHGDEVVLGCRLLEDLAHHAPQLSFRRDAAGRQLLVQGIELLHGQLVQDRPRRPQDPLVLRLRLHRARGRCRRGRRGRPGETLRQLSLCAHGVAEHRAWPGSARGPREGGGANCEGSARGKEHRDGVHQKGSRRDLVVSELALAARPVQGRRGRAPRPRRARGQ